MEVLLNRRSTRQFTDEPVSEADINDLLRAAMQAPSAGNQMPWDFVVVTDLEMRKQLRTVSQYATPALNAPLDIVVCTDSQHLRFPGNEVLDCSAATQNILLAAQAKGLGAVWLGVAPEADRVAKLNQILGLPPHVQAFAIVAIGHPKSPLGAATPRFDASRVHLEHW